MKLAYLSNANVQEVLELRERGWESLPPPPVLSTKKPKLTRAGQDDPSATPVVTSLGLPNTNPEPQPLRSPQIESIVVPEPETTAASLTTHSSSVSIATLSDFTIPDTSDDE